MKMLIGLLIGLVSGVIVTVLIVHTTVTVKAQEPTSPETVTEDSTGLLPDVGKIYHQCLGSPFRQVEEEIYDPDIARYYHNLMQQTGLDQIGQEN
jgi:hypothetical protein